MIYIFWSAANENEAESVIRALLERGLIACGSMIPSVTSLYLWKGKVEKTSEIKVILKTKKSLFGTVEGAICEMASYDVPEICAVPVGAVSAAYAEWIETSLEGR